MSKFFTIGELAKLYDISTDALRYYEDLGLLIPKRAKNNYRIYSSEDLWRLNIIRDLRTLDFSMERIRDYLDHHNIDSTMTLLQDEMSVIEKQIQKLEHIRTNLTHRYETLQGIKQEAVGSILIKTLPKRRCHQILQGYSTDSDMDLLIRQLVDFDQENLFIIGNQQMGSVLDHSAFDKGNFREYSSVFILHDHGEACIPEGDYLTISYRGDCSQNNRYIPLLLQYADKHGINLCQPFLELLVLDIHTSDSTEEHITELQFHISP